MTGYSMMSNNMNMAITIFGFVLSALFIMVICCRLLCSRFRQHNNPLEMFQSEERSTIQRSIHGLEPSVVTCFPTINFNQHIFTSSEDNVCTICLGDYKEKEILRILPRCGHAFHIACIDMWLRQHHTCPVCRISLQNFSEGRQLTGALISLVAKARFVPGALPDHLFEQPKNYCSVSVGVGGPTGISKEGLGWPVVAEDGEDLEAGESSSWRHQVALGLVRNDEIESGDRQLLLEPRVNMDLDALLHHEALALSANFRGLCHSGCMPDAPKEDISLEGDVPSHTNVAAAGAQVGGPTANQSSAHI
eukprot:c2041_g1_i2 orf=361-1278(-)